MTNSEDPDEMPHNTAFHQAMYCLLSQIEFQESDVSPGKTEVKQGKVEFISPAKGYFRETYKSHNINSISLAPSSPWLSCISKLKAYQLLFSR